MPPSLLDRLMDLDPANRREPAQRRLSFSQAREAVGRDLENLLNTRRYAHLPENCQQVGRSVLLYGLSDFTGKNPGDPSLQAELRDEIERAVRLFEPRLSRVSVRLEEPDGRERRLRFRIGALLVMEKEAEPVSFDTFFDINRGDYFVVR